MKWARWERWLAGSLVLIVSLGLIGCLFEKTQARDVNGDGIIEDYDGDGILDEGIRLKKTELTETVEGIAGPWGEAVGTGLLAASNIVWAFINRRKEKGVKAMIEGSARIIKRDEFQKDVDIIKETLRNAQKDEGVQDFIKQKMKKYL